MRWFVYVLVSRARRTTYVGIARDVGARLVQHNGFAPGGAAATRAGRPWVMGRVHGPFRTRGAAQAAEARVKAERGAARLAWRGDTTSGSKKTP